MASQSSNVEILVHVSASSKAANDAVYRQLAQSYIAFQPRKRTNVASTLTQRQRDRTAAKDLRPSPAFTQSGLQKSQQHSTQQYFSAADQEHAFGPDSQDLSFKSALDNRSSPRLQASRNVSTSPRASAISTPPQAASIQLQDSWCPLPSQISDSYPLPTNGVVQVTPTRILRQYVKERAACRGVLVSSSPSLPDGSYPDSSPGGGLEHVDVPSSIPIPDTERELVLAHQYVVAASKVIPVTPLVPGLLARKRREQVEDEEEAPDTTALFDITHISSSDVSHHSTAPVSRAESEPPPAKRPKTVNNEGDITALIRSSSDTGPMRSSGVTLPSTNRFDSLFEIRPPSPPAGMDDITPSDIVSDKLAKLSRDLSSRYRPEAKRQIDCFERGYWLLDCTTWTPETRRETWNFLSNYLCSGLAGWGVWCRRGNDHNWIRMYCWGHVAKHTYLLLYLASGRQIKMTGAQWLGADGEVVLEVGPVGRQP